MRIKIVGENKQEKRKAVAEYEAGSWLLLDLCDEHGHVVAQFLVAVILENQIGNIIDEMLCALVGAVLDGIQV